MKTVISRKFEFDMGHRIPDHESLCRNAHGHRYVVEVAISGPVIETQGHPQRGMVMDYSYLKEIMSSFFEKLDHGFMVYKEDPLAGAFAQFERNFHTMKTIEVDFIPTAENIAAHIFEQAVRRSLPVEYVTVWETPNCKATVTR